MILVSEQMVVSMIYHWSLLPFFCEVPPCCAPASLEAAAAFSAHRMLPSARTLLQPGQLLWYARTAHCDSQPAGVIKQGQASAQSTKGLTWSLTRPLLAPRLVYLEARLDPLWFGVLLLFPPVPLSRCTAAILCLLCLHPQKLSYLHIPAALGHPHTHMAVTKLRMHSHAGDVRSHKVHAMQKYACAWCLPPIAAVLQV